MVEIHSTDLSVTIITILLPLFIMGLLFSLCDGKRDYIEQIKSLSLKEWGLLSFLVFMLAIFMVGTIAGLASNIGHLQSHLWFPYVFGGMPSYACPGVVGVKWWNGFWVLTKGISTILITNAIGLWIFGLVFYWFWKKQRYYKYILLFIAEIFMLGTTDWLCEKAELHLHLIFGIIFLTVLIKRRKYAKA